MAPLKMAGGEYEVYSEKNIRFTLPLGITFPFLGFVIPVDSPAVIPFVGVLTLIWLKIYFDLLGALIPPKE